MECAYYRAVFKAILTMDYDDEKTTTPSGCVRFAPKCTGECLDVFPEYRGRNFGVPELTGHVKITSK